MNPLLVTFAPLIPNEVGERNRETLIRLGFDHLYFRPNQRVHRHLSRRFFVERGNPKVAWDAGVNAIPVQTAAKLGIPLVFYAEHGESEYGGRVLSEEHRKIRDVTEVIEHQIGDDPRNWVDDVVSERDLNPYVYPEALELEAVGVKAVYFAYFFRWSMLENFRFLHEKIPFATHPEGRTPGTFTDFDSLDDKSDNLYYYMQFVKFGFGRAVRDACRMIQNDQLTRAEALELARLYDGEFPEEHLDDMLDYVEMSREELLETIDLHRNPELWERVDGEWRLTHPLPVA
jgi:N-acetyl sugar amidotransferase